MIVTLAFITASGRQINLTRSIDCLLIGWSSPPSLYHSMLGELRFKGTVHPGPIEVQETPWSSACKTISNKLAGAEPHGGGGDRA
jgi:hypothetical protein